ncbi:hypothetical protein SKAU_G00205520 [Synaphobranchus kaupii]|uniref:Uncharacterized protein n=1 Tax=Synaphobranchus kaupii TaxID=118154 RepID=A0A9Q1IYM0_SYNKA|nr:hypothetical protein SKAU_G00205520 [Synaphobranchus kaupii]
MGSGALSNLILRLLTSRWCERDLKSKWSRPTVHNVAESSFVRVGKTCSLQAMTEVHSAQRIAVVEQLNTRSSTCNPGAF